MVEVIHDKHDGKIIAYIDMSLRDRFGNRCQDGDCMFIHDLWIHNDYRFKYTWKIFLYRAIRLYPQLEYVYWERKKYNDRMKTCRIEQLQRS